MAAKAILHMLSTLKHMSPFDVNMAVDAGYDVTIPYTNVTLDEVSALVQDAMFSRAPSAALRTGIFFAGRDAVLGPGHVGRGQEGAAQAIRNFAFCRSLWLLHHSRRHGRLR